MAKIDSDSLTVDGWVDFANQCKIISGKSIIPFEPWPHQKDMCRNFLSNPRMIIDKDRAVGVTEAFTNMFLCMASKDEYTTLILSQNADSSYRAADRAMLMASSHPDLETRKTTHSEIALKGGGSIRFETSIFRTSGSLGPRSFQFYDAILIDDVNIFDAGDLLESRNLLGSGYYFPKVVITLSTPSGWRKYNTPSRESLCG